jgi:hypothetical protein
VEWARTLRIDAPPSDRVRSRVVAALSHDGLHVRFGSGNIARTYILVEGSAATDPSELRARLPDARAYDEAIIALAIEPTPRDALPALAEALGGRGAPAGVLDAQIFGDEIVIELRPSVTPPSMVFRIVGVELQRFQGFRRTQLLTPLPTDLVARIAGEGLQAPEISAERILESLLEAAHVE